MSEAERSLAVFIDFENLVLDKMGERRFDIGRILERLVEKGKIVVKKAYADWHRYYRHTSDLHEAAIELIEVPKRGLSGKNSADIRLCVDAMDLAYSKDHINTFAVISGDSDFSPLVSKLKELGKHVIGLGMQDSTSDLLRDNCDEFIYYEDLVQAPMLVPTIDSHLPETKRKAFSLLLESLLALRRENKENLWSSMIKDTIKRKKPSFNETYHGYRTFSELLEDAQKEGLLELDTDKRSRTYVVTRFGSEMHQADSAASEAAVTAPTVLPVPALAAPAGEVAPRKRSRRRRRRGQGAAALPGNGNNGAAPPEARPAVAPPEARPTVPAPPAEPRRHVYRPEPPVEIPPPRPPEPEPAPPPAAVEPAAVEPPAPAKPAARRRTTTRTPRQGTTTTRTRRKAAATEEPPPPPAES